MKRTTRACADLRKRLCRDRFRGTRSTLRASLARLRGGKMEIVRATADHVGRFLGNRSVLLILIGRALLSRRRISRRGCFSVSWRDQWINEAAYLASNVGTGTFLLLASLHAADQQSCLAYQQGTVGCSKYGAPAATAVPGPSMDGGVTTMPNANQPRCSVGKCHQTVS